jgi:hypothetical protein
MAPRLCYFPIYCPSFTLHILSIQFLSYLILLCFLPTAAHLMFNWHPCLSQAVISPFIHLQNMPTSLKLHCLNVICRHTQFVPVGCAARFLSYQQSSGHIWPEVSPYISRADSLSFLMALHPFLYPSRTLWLLLAIIVQTQGLHSVSGSSSFIWPVTNHLWCLSCLWCNVSLSLEMKLEESNLSSDRMYPPPHSSVLLNLSSVTVLYTCCCTYILPT